MRLFHNINVDFISKRKIFYIVSIVITVLGLLVPIIKGLHFGIDFLGGTEVVVQFEKEIDIGTVRAATSKMGIGNPELKTFGTTANNILIRTPLQEIDPNQFSKIQSNIEALLKKNFPDTVFSLKEKTASTLVYQFDSSLTASNASDLLFNHGFQAGALSQEKDNREVIVRLSVSDLIKEGLRSSFPDLRFNVIKEDKVGPKIGAELRRDALLAVIFSWIVILVYLGFRFKFVFAAGAVIALIHDVLVALAFVSLFDGLIPGLNLEISQGVLAAFLTIVGFSVNDTVIIFDRIRENLKIHKTMDLKELMNMSINRTLSRTVITSGTVLLVTLVLLLFGGEVNKGFAFTFMVGIITGTYSSIYVASALVYDYVLKTKRKITF
ncbi:MAG: protein translocase subunit SecF [Ignavibacteria bacterium]|nr:protein translocase subunit SecF [Ignavibacteria bacterium]